MELKCVRPTKRYIHKVDNKKSILYKKQKCLSPTVCLINDVAVS